MFGLCGVSVATVAFANLVVGDPVLQMLCDFKHRPDFALFNQRPAGGTPTDTALWYARAALLPRPESRKMILLLTDGLPNNIAQTKIAAERCTRDGIDIIALGIMTDEVKQIWDCHRVITQLENLPRELFMALEQSLAVVK